MSKRGPKKASSKDLRIREPPPLPSLDELIAESRALGWDDLADSMERVRYLESPKGQKALERRERRLSRL
jgi:hypothetical protein